MALDSARTEVSAQYVDHNLIREDNKNPDLFFFNASRRNGVWFSRPGNGASHPLHQQRFGKPDAFRTSRLVEFRHRPGCLWQTSFAVRRAGRRHH